MASFGMFPILHLMPPSSCIKVGQTNYQSTSSVQNQLNTTTLRKMSVFLVRSSSVSPASSPTEGNDVPLVLTSTTSQRMSPVNSVESSTAKSAHQLLTAPCVIQKNTGSSQKKHKPVFVHQATSRRKTSACPAAS